MSRFGREKVPGFVHDFFRELFCVRAALFSSCAVHHKQKIPRRMSEDFCGGRYRTRTCDLLHVKQMLYQLS